MRVNQMRAFLDGVRDHVASGGYDIVHAMLPIHACDIYHPHAGMAAKTARKWSAIFNRRRVLLGEVEERLLTGAKAPVVLYRPAAISGARWPWDIPVEDFGFAFAMITLTLVLWERVRSASGEAL